MKLKEWIYSYKDLFCERDLRFLLKNVFCQNYFSLREDIPLDKKTLDYLEEIKREYQKGVPLAYLLGKEEFFGWEFKVNPSSFIPRPETERLVEEAIELIKKHNLKFILDLGTGCGNIGICLKKILKGEVEIFASDKNFSSLKVARQNIKIHKVKVNLIQTDLFLGFKKSCFDLIISNPPYVESLDIKGSLEYEPKEALDGGRCGTEVIKKIILFAPLFLKKEGFLILEIGYNQKEKIISLIRNLDYKVEKWIKDYSGFFRGVILKYG
jgi:release factor glutamine methyltransferase